MSCIFTSSCDPNITTEDSSKVLRNCEYKKCELANSNTVVDESLFFRTIVNQGNAISNQFQCSNQVSSISPQTRNTYNFELSSELDNCDFGTPSDTNSVRINNLYFLKYFFN